MDAGERLTMHEVPAFLDRARAALAGGDASIGLAALTAVDSAALAALIALRREAGGAGPAFVDPPQNLRKLALLYGVDGLLFDA